MRLALVLALLLASGCADAPSDVPADAPAETPADLSAAPETAALPANDGLPPALAGLNLQTNHATGSVLRVTGVRFEGDHIAVDIAFTNGSDREQKLNQYSNNDFVLRDDAGNVYHLSAPPNNGDVSVPAGQSLEGEFVFLGRINPQATALTLVTNEDYGSDTDYARDPKMTIQIPMTS